MAEDKMVTLLRRQYDELMEAARAHEALAIRNARQAVKFQIALEQIRDLDGGYPDDYCSIAREALDT